MVFAIIRRLEYLYGVPSLDNFIFKLCYRWTVILLIIFSCIVTCKLWLGYSMDCEVSQVIDKYAIAKCYDSPLYNSLELLQKSDLYSSNDESEDKKHYMTYYPIVNLLFLMHAFNFYLPHLLWKSYERGYVHKLTAGIQKYLDKEEKRDVELCRLAKHAFVTQGKHKLYTMLYILLEIFNFIISLSHTLWLIHFFNIITFPDSIRYNTWSDFKNFYFPPEAYCSYRKIGASGVFQRYQSLCQLPLNSLYMKMYLFLYAWYIAITVLTGLMLAYRIFLLVPSFRVIVSKILSPFTVTSILKSVCQQLSYSDWFFLSRLHYAMTDIDFAKMIDKLEIISQGKDPLSDEYRRFTMLDDIPKDSDSLTVTSPV